VSSFQRVKSLFSKILKDDNLSQFIKASALIYCSIVIIISTEEAAHIDGFNLFFLYFLDNCGSLCWPSGSSCSWGILRCFEESGGLWESITGCSTGGNEVFESVQKGVWSRCCGWEPSSEGKTGLDTGGSLEFGEDSTGAEVQDLSVEETSILENLGDHHLVRERIDLQFLEKGTLGTIYSNTGFNNLLGNNNFNLGLDNLGLDLKILEERSLLWIKSGWSGWDPYIGWGNHTWLGWGWSDFFIEDLLNLGKISVGEDNIGVSLKLEDDLLDVVIGSPVGSTYGSVIGITIFWLGVKS
jgi:hypothetical protein